MADTHVTITGNLTDDPEVTFTQRRRRLQLPGGRDRPHQGRRGLARRRHQLLPHHRLARPGRAHRRLPRQGQPGDRRWPAPGPLLGDPEGERRSVVEVQAEEVGPSLRWATAKPERHHQAVRPVQRRPAVLTLASSEAGAVVTRPGLAHQGSEDPRMHPLPYPTRPGPAPALHLLHGIWVASCPTCGFQLTTAHPGPLRTPGTRRCPVCYQDGA